MVNGNGGTMHSPEPLVTPARGVFARRRCFWMIAACTVIVGLFVAVLWPRSQPAWDTSRSGEQMRSDGHMAFHAEQLVPLYPEQVVTVEDSVGIVAVSRDGLVVTGTQMFNVIRFTDIQTGQRVQRLIGDGLWPGGLALSPDGSTLAVAANGRTGTKEASILQIWDVHSKSVRRSIPVGENYISRVLFDPAAENAYCQCRGKDAGVFAVNLRTGLVETVFRPSRHGNVSVDRRPDPVKLLAISPDGKRLVLGMWTYALVWNLQRANEEFSCPVSPRTMCRSAAVSPDGKLLVTAGGEVEVWDFDSGRRIAKAARGMRGSGDCITFSPDGTLLVASADVRENIEAQYLQVWRVPNYSNVIVIECEGSSLVGKYFLSGTNRLVCGTSDNTMSVWNLDQLSWPRKP